MTEVNAYRAGSVAMALGYALLVWSILANPPIPTTTSHATVFDVAFPAMLWVCAFSFAAAFTVVTAAFAPKGLLLGHVFLVTCVLPYGVANLGTSIINDTGWQIASLCAALGGGHFLAIKLRP